MMNKRIRLPVTFWTLATKVISELKPRFQFTVTETAHSTVIVESTIDGLQWLCELAIVMMNDTNVSSNYRVTARRAWWRLKYMLDALHLDNTDVICVDGVYVHLTENKA